MARRGDLAAVMTMLVLTGCVTTYQPLTGFQRPVAVNPSLPNLEGLRVQVRCLPSDFVKGALAKRLCSHVEKLFTNQGAIVSTRLELGMPADADLGGEDIDPGGPPQLIVDLKSRLVDDQPNRILWLVCFGTFTLSPAVTEYTFAQDVVVRDAQGFLLSQESLQARLVRYFGFGVWAVNNLLDFFARDDSEKLTGSVMPRDFTRDFDAQLSQIVFNAKRRADVLQAQPLGGP